jgi:hypothetical protein
LLFDLSHAEGKEGSMLLAIALRHRGKAGTANISVTFGVRCSQAQQGEPVLDQLVITFVTSRD